MTAEEQWLLDEKYNGEKTAGFFTDCARLSSGEPLAYIIGNIPFLGTKISLRSHPLIPRPETEYWVERAIGELRTREKAPIKVLDLCAGSGCIGIAVLSHLEHTCVDFAEIDTRHIETIVENITQNGINPDRARMLVSDLFSNVTGTYDMILTNPPYIDPKVDRVESSVRKHEPKNALYGGTDGMFFIDKILRGAPNHLAPRGILYIEHEPEQAAQIRISAHDIGFSNVSYPDQFGTIRFTRLTRGNE